MAFEDDYDPRILREFMNQMQESGKITEELAKEIEKSNTSFAKLRKEGMANAVKNFKDMAGSSKDFATSLAGGARGFDALNPAIDAATMALDAMVGWVPILGDAVNKSAGLVAAGSKLMLSQLQNQVDAFQTVGEVGGLAADGLEGLQDQFLNSGLTLQSYTKAIQNSATSLARFRGLTGDGARDFSEIVGSLTRSTDLGLRRLGLSADDMGESTEAFLKRQTRLGLSQTLTNAQVAQSTTAYIKELDLLSKVTGQSRKAIQAQQDAALSETRFRASIEAMRGTVDEGAINSILNFQTSISDMDATLGAGVRDLASGFTATEAARRAEFVTGGRASKIMEALRSGQINELQAREQMQQALRDNRDQLIFAGRALGDNASIIADTSGLFDIINAEIDANGQFIRRANKAQQDQITGSNKLTDSAVSAQQGIEGMQINMQRLFFEAMPFATDVVDSFAKTMNEGIISITSMFNPELANEMNQTYFRMTGNAVKLTNKAFDEIDSRLAASKGLGKELVSDNELISALKGMGVDTLKEGWTLDFAKQYGLNETQTLIKADKSKSVADVFGGFNSIKFDGSRNISTQQMIDNFKADRGFAEGGIATGPKTGYKAMLHGTEAIVPLEGSSGIPVDIQGQSQRMGEQLDLMKDQVSKLDQMISILTQSNNISNKILSASYS